MPDLETRARRQLLRGRALLVRFRTRLKNRIHAYLAEQNERVGASDLYGRAGRAWLATVPLPPDVRDQVALLLELVDQLTERLTRFSSAHALASDAGLVPSTRSSGGKTAHGTVGAAGSHWLKWILIEAVQTLKRRPGPVQAHDERLFRAKGKPKATVAAARKLCTYLYWMLVKGWSDEEWLQQHETTKREGHPVQSLASVA